MGHVVQPPIRFLWMPPVMYQLDASMIPELNIELVPDRSLIKLLSKLPRPFMSRRRFPLADMKLSRKWFLARRTLCNKSKFLVLLMKCVDVPSTKSVQYQEKIECTKTIKVPKQVEVCYPVTKYKQVPYHKYQTVRIPRKEECAEPVWEQPCQPCEPVCDPCA